MQQRTFKLSSSTLAMLDENTNQASLLFPANAVVTVVLGDPDRNGFVRVRYLDQVLAVFAVDLRNRGQRIWRQSA